MVEVVRSVGESRRLDVAIHLDHGTTREVVMNCVRGGFTSVMYDGSASTLDENLAVTKWVVEAAHAAGLSVEGEIGAIGQTGEFGEEVANSQLADLGSAVALAGTGIDCLALAYGSAHGFYSAEPSLDFDLLAAVADRVDIPIVLHGGTGIPEDQIRKSIDLGVAKINFSAVLRRAFISAMREHLEKQPDELSIMAVLSAGSQRMKEPEGLHCPVPVSRESVVSAPFSVGPTDCRTGRVRGVDPDPDGPENGVELNWKTVLRLYLTTAR